MTYFRMGNFWRSNHGKWDEIQKKLTMKNYSACKSSKTTSQMFLVLFAFGAVLVCFGCFKRETVVNM